RDPEGPAGRPGGAVGPGEAAPDAGATRRGFGAEVGTVPRVRRSGDPGDRDRTTPRTHGPQEFVMMSTIGKVLVLLHGALSITVLAWVIGVFTNRIDWNNPPAKAGQEGTVGLFDRQKAKAAEYNVAVDRAHAR